MRKVLILAVLLSGCAVDTIRPQAPANVSQRDWNACRYEALRIEASNPNVLIGMQYARESMQMCLNSRGY